MTRRFISQLGEHETVDQIYQVTNKQLRTNRNGNLYLQVQLADRSGSVTAMLWNANDQVYASFDSGEYVRVQATTQFYNGALQMIAQRIERVDPHSVDEADFQTLGTGEVDQLAARLSDMLRGVENVHLRCLAESFLMDEAFMAKFTRAPAGVKNHHAYHGGLLEHVVSLMELTKAVAPIYPQLDGDLLMMGAFLHDIGKIDELTFERDLGYSDEGQLVGHLVMAVEMLNNKISEAAVLCSEPFPPQLHVVLKHMILSHHGEYEFGSPKLPMTPEAMALHYLDNLDAKLQLFDTLIQGDANTDSNWTPYHPNLGRKLFKTAPAETSTGDPAD
jgi:3'-5' exoribonuclease